MWSLILGKVGTFMPAILIGLIGGVALDQKVFRSSPVPCPQCPACICPEPTVEAQRFDMDKMKGVKEFNYMPEFTGNISVAGVDSSMIKKYLDQAVKKYCQDLNTNAKRKRK